MAQRASIQKSATPAPNGAAGTAGLDGALARRLLGEMMLIRRFEEKAAEHYALGNIGGFLHLSIGEEAVAVGTISTLRPDDYAISTYREHGHCLAKGSDPRRAMAELFGRRDGLSKGKGGSMHLFDKSTNFLGGHAIVGAHLPIATGVGFAIKYRGGDQVIVCFFGDGAVPEGEFHESLNLAALWKLPVIFICENNRYAMGTSIERALAQHDIYKFGEIYGIPSEPADGMDVLAIRDAVGRAVARSRADKTPALIEARTYRFRGHSMRDPAGAVYRTKEEVEREKLRDPILIFRDRVVKAGLLSDEDVQTIEKDVNDRIDEAVAFAEASPEPPLEWLHTDIFLEPEGAGEPSQGSPSIKSGSTSPLTPPSGL
jgi:pyruvate dehydrogenase E1 component alpha subunit